MTKLRLSLAEKAMEIFFAGNEAAIGKVTLKTLEMTLKIHEMTPKTLKMTLKMTPKTSSFLGRGNAGF